MTDAVQHLPAIIEQAAKSPLGLIALMVMALAGMAFVFFKTASERTRVGIFLLLLAGVAAFSAAAMRVSPAGGDEPQAPATDVVGEWTSTVTYGGVRNGEPWWVDETFRFRELGGVLVGTADWMELPRDMKELEVAGDSVTFVTRDTMVAGDESREVTRRYIGAIEDENTIRFIMQTEGGFAGDGPVEFVARRTKK